MSRSLPQRVALTRLAQSILALGLISLGSCTPAHLPGDDDDPQGVCGDGRVNGEETCDDGNAASGDGCSSECQPEIPPNCGDGILVPEEGEECDDGNMEGGDGCGLGCWIEGCGNGFLDPGEACEDGNNVEGDGCSIDCKSDESCGNGIIDTAVGETCDDGDTDDTDNCPATCEPARCGDGFVQKGIESCDDGNGTADDGCTECILDSCGDANLDDGEECDQGAANGSDSSSCFRTCLTTEIVMEAGQNELLHSEAEDLNDAIESIEVADLDNDGIADFIAVSPVNARGTIVHGQGDGTFGFSSFLRSVFSGVSRSVLTDVNGDGADDLIMTTSTSNTVVTLLGEGRGFVFNSAATTTLDVGGVRPVALVVAELNGDGFVDVATANQDSSDVTILLGDGTGAFVVESRFGTQSGNGGNNPIAISAGDVTGDGVLDLVTANASSDVAVLRGLGGGSFAAPVISSTVLGAQGTGPSDLVLADVTNDGKLDVITVNSSSSDVTVLAQQGDGLATPLAFPTFVGDEGTNPRRLAVGDVNKDGVPDLVATTPGHISVLLGLGAGVAFGAPLLTPGTVAEEAVNLNPLVLGDINGDNTLDVVAGSSSNPRDVRTFIGDGAGGFSTPRAFHLDTARSNQTATNLHVRDLDADGRVDVVAVSSVAAMVMRGDGNGKLLGSSVFTTGSRSVGIGDFNGDGRGDFIGGNSTSQTILFGLQGVSGRFTLSNLTSPQTSTHTVAAAGDFNGNGNDDAVVSNIGFETAVLLEGAGTGSFVPFSPAFVQLTGAGESMAVADMSEDGNLDILVSIPSQNEVNLLSGDGAGNFTNPSLLPTQVGNSGQTPIRVVAADIDGQMGLDVVTANSSTQDFSVLRSMGNGTFGDAKVVPAVFGGEPAGLRDLATGDVNGDGFIDIISANTARSTISVVIGFGNGNFAAPQTFNVERPTAVGVADVDGDGLADVVVGTESARVVVFLGKGHP